VRGRLDKVARRQRVLHDLKGANGVSGAQLMRHCLALNVIQQVLLNGA
jgi:LPS sulfotransferase NodH